MNDEIEVEFRPIKKIVIFETIKLSEEELLQRLRLLAMSGQPHPLNWAEGLLFLMIPFYIECDSVFQETKKGIRFWSTVMYTPMPKYKSLHKIGGVEIPIIDQTPSQQFRRIAQEVKNRKQ